MQTYMHICTFNHLTHKDTNRYISTITQTIDTYSQTQTYARTHAQTQADTDTYIHMNKPILILVVAIEVFLNPRLIQRRTKTGCRRWVKEKSEKRIPVLANIKETSGLPAWCRCAIFLFSCFKPFLQKTLH